MLIRFAGIALRLVGLLVPEAGRERWRLRWPDSVDDYAAWVASRGLPRAEVRKLLLRYVRDGASEAVRSRWELPELRDAWKRRLRGPWAALILPVTVLLAGLWWSHGLSLLRTALQTPDASFRWVTAVPERSFFGKNQGFTPRQFAVIRTRAQSYSALGGYAMRLQPVDGEPRRVAFVTPGLFGLTAGKAFAAEQLGLAWFGKSIETGGKRYVVAGIWPRDLRPALARPDFWIADLAEDKSDTTLVAMLKPGVTREQATVELRDLLLSAPPRKGTGTPTAVVSLRHSQEGMLRALSIGYLVTALALAGYAAWRAVTRKTWRLELFFLAKVLPLLTGVFCASVVWFGAWSSGTAAGPFFIFWMTGIGATLGIWWARRDQQLRCPECLARMTLSVQIGTHGAALLEGVGDELLCEYGHGSLWLPGAASQAFGPEVWRSE